MILSTGRNKLWKHSPCLGEEPRKALVKWRFQGSLLQFPLHYWIFLLGGGESVCFVKQDFRAPDFLNQYSTCPRGCTTHTPLLTTSHSTQCSAFLLQNECHLRAGIGYVHQLGLSSFVSVINTAEIGWERRRSAVPLDDNKTHSFNKEREWAESNGPRRPSNCEVWRWRLLACSLKCDILNCVTCLCTCPCTHTCTHVLMFLYSYLCMNMQVCEFILYPL